MSDFTRAEIFSEVADILGGFDPPDKAAGGVSNAPETHASILSTASITFLLHPTAVFYLARLVANTLTNVLRQEASMLEDMLVAIDDLQNVGERVESTTSLSNASTALLELDAAESVSGRPEMERFSNIIDGFTETLRINVVRDEQLVYPRNSSQAILRADLVELKRLHPILLRKLDNLTYLLDNYKAQDLPSQASRAIFTNARAALDGLAEALDEAENNIELSRTALLRSIACKVAVNFVSTFADPAEVKFRSPIRPIPPGTTHLGRVTGEGTPAFVRTAPGPWVLPLTGITLQINGGPSQPVDISSYTGAIINGRNSETFNIVAASKQVHVVLDPDPIDTAATGVGAVNYAPVNAGRPIGFKHIYGMMRFPDRAGADLYPRAIISSNIVGTAATCTWNPSADMITATWSVSPLTLFEGAVFVSRTYQEYEIVELISAIEFIIDSRGETVADGAGACYIAGSTGASHSIGLYFVPSLTTVVASGERVIIGPIFKTSKLTAGATRTAAQVVADLNDKTSTDGGNALTSLAVNVKATVSTDDATKISLMLRNKLDPYMQIASQFPRPDPSTPGFSTIESSANDLLGFPLGALDTDTLLTPEELVAAINSQTSGVLASIEEEVVATGTLSTTEGSKVAVDTSTDFSALGVGAGWLLDIELGDSGGVYSIDSVATSTITVRARFDFASAETGLPYTVRARRVRIDTLTAAVGNSLKIVSADSEFGLPSSIVYGQLTQFEAVDKLGNLLEFAGVEHGDLLKITGQSEVTISEVGTQLLTLETALPSTVSAEPFVISGAGSRAFEAMKARLVTFASSRQLLNRYGLDENVDAIDAALSSAVTPGARFASNLNQARFMVSRLLSILTTNLRRATEYSATVPSAPDTLESILSSYSANQTGVLDNLIQSLQDRKYDRAVALMLDGDIEGFFSTTEETASYAGSVLEASRAVSGDLPEPPGFEEDVNDPAEAGLLFFEDPDPDANFTDTYEDDWEELEEFEE